MNEFIMTFWQKFSLLNKRIKLVIYSGIVVLLYAAAGFILLPFILKPIVIDTLTDKLERQVQLEVIEFNPFTLSMTLKGFSVNGKHANKLVSFDLLTINFQAYPLIQKTISFDEIIINKPQVSVLILANGEFNFQDIIVNNTSSSNENANTSEAAWVFAIEKFRHNEGIINFSDLNRQSPYHHNIKEINIALDNFSTKPGDNNIHHVNAKTSQGTELNWQGKFSLSPLRSSGDISLVSNLHIISDYLQKRTLFSITEGTLKLNSHYDVNFSNEESQFTINNLIASISTLEIRRQSDNKKIITSDKISLDLEQINSSNKSILINSISNENSFIALNKDKTSKIDIEDLFILQNVNQADDSIKTAQIDNSIRNNIPTDQTDQTENKNNNWDLEIKNINTTKNNIIFTDSSVFPSATHDIIIESLTVEHLKPFTDELARLSSNLGLNKQGVIKVKGTIMPKSKQISLAIETEQISLNDFQPYINSVTNMKILDGELATNLNINIDAADTLPLLKINGDIKISSLSMIETQLNEEFLSWKSLMLDGIQFTYPEQKLTLAAININAPFLRLAIIEGGTTNIQKLLKPVQTITPNPETKNDETKTENSSTEQSFTAEIDKINIVNGELDFSDTSLIPTFSAGIYNLNGDISGLSSKNDSRAKIDLKGKVDKYAPVIIKGSINPLSHDAFTDIDMLFKGIELTTFTPYSGKFAGYKIDKGKLSLGLHYKLSNNQLVAENNVTLDQLTLGDVVNSEEATSLPVKFALSMLKDANGVIAFNLPIRGDIDNPDFKYSSLVWGALGNLITGIISSPFKALASLVGGDSDNFDHVTFTANSFDVNEKEQLKLNSLAKALLQRPSLYIEIRGASSNLIDHDEMAYAKILKQLQLTPRTLSGVLSEDEKVSLIAYYHSLNTKAAQEAPSKQADTRSTLTEKEHAQQKEQFFKDAIKFILAETPITDAEYLLLAKQRALQIQKYLIETAQVPSANVFLLDSSIEIENKHANVEVSQITLPLSLKAK